MHDAAQTIITFAGHLADPSQDARTKAVERAWIDSAGLPTHEGMALHRALMDQTGTRSTFRNLA